MNAKEKIDALAKQAGESKTMAALMILMEEVDRLRDAVHQINQYILDEKDGKKNSDSYLRGQIANLTGRLDVLAPVCESLLEGKIDDRLKRTQLSNVPETDTCAPMFPHPRIR